MFCFWVNVEVLGGRCFLLVAYGDCSLTWNVDLILGLDASYDLWVLVCLRLSFILRFKGFSLVCFWVCLLLWSLGWC